MQAADLKRCLDVVVHHLNVGLVHADSSSSKPACLVDGDILQLRTVVPALFKYQQHLLQCKMSLGQQTDANSADNLVKQLTVHNNN